MLGRAVTCGRIAAYRAGTENSAANPVAAMRNLAFCLAGCTLAIWLSLSGTPFSGQEIRSADPRAYLGFDRNDYPGDANLAVLRRTFSFTGYWLNVPPGAQS